MAYDIPLSSTRVPIVFGPLVLSSDHITGATGLTTATMLATLSKAGTTSYAAASGALKEMGFGMYFFAGSTLDSNTAGPVTVHVTATSGNDPYDQVVAQVIDGTVSIYGANTIQVGGTVQTARDLGASVLLSSGTGTGQLSMSAGVAAVNVTQFNSSAINTAVAQVGANAVQLGGTVQTGRDVGANVLISSGTAAGQLSLSSGTVLLQPTQTGVTIPTVTNLTNAPTAGDFTSTMKASIAASAVASVTGAVGSVTGAVGSVTGAVGSVTGAVGSVTGAVGSVTGAVTVGTNTDKTGYSLSQVFPTNFSVLAISTAGNVTAGSTQTYPTNFATLAIDGSGFVTYNNAAPPTAASIATAVLTTAMTESYRANGGTGTLAQVMYEMLAHLGESSISGTVKTINKLDHATAAETFSLNSATAPTSVTRAS